MSSGSRKEKGQVLVMFALFLAMLLAFVAMAVDFGIYLHERRQLQNAADAAALACVAYLPGLPALAENNAYTWAENNGMDSSEITAVEFEDGNTLCRVKVKRNVGMIFARVLGILDMDIPASAAAKVGSLKGVTGLVPFGVLDAIVKPCKDVPVCPLVVLKYDVDDSGATIGDLDYDGKGGGANEVNDKIKGGNKDPLCSTSEQPPLPPGCATKEPQKSGNSVGQIRDGVNWRIDNTTGECDTIAEVLGPDLDGDGILEIKTECNPWGGAVVGDTDGDGGTCDNIVWQGDPRGSCRLIAIPVIKGVGPGGLQLPPPNSDATNVEFALFWLEPFDPPGSCFGNDCLVRGYFINAEVSVSGLLGVLDPSITPFVVYKLVE